MYSYRSERWKFPDYYYTISWKYLVREGTRFYEADAQCLNRGNIFGIRLDLASRDSYGWHRGLPLLNSRSEGQLPR